MRRCEARKRRELESAAVVYRLHFVSQEVDPSPILGSILTRGRRLSGQWYHPKDSLRRTPYRANCPMTPVSSECHALGMLEEHPLLTLSQCCRWDIRTRRPARTTSLEFCHHPHADFRPLCKNCQLHGNPCGRAGFVSSEVPQQQKRTHTPSKSREGSWFWAHPARVRLRKAMIAFASCTNASMTRLLKPRSRASCLRFRLRAREGSNDHEGSSFRQSIAAS